MSPSWKDENEELVSLYRDLLRNLRFSTTKSLEWRSDLYATNSHITRSNFSLHFFTLFKIAFNQNKLFLNDINKVGSIILFKGKSNNIY